MHQLLLSRDPVAFVVSAAILSQAIERPPLRLVVRHWILQIRNNILERLQHSVLLVADTRPADEVDRAVFGKDVGASRKIGIIVYLQNARPGGAALGGRGNPPERCRPATQATAGRCSFAFERPGRKRRSGLPPGCAAGLRFRRGTKPPTLRPTFCSRRCCPVRHRMAEML